MSKPPKGSEFCGVYALLGGAFAALLTSIFAYGPERLLTVDAKSVAPPAFATIIVGVIAAAITFTAARTTGGMTRLAARIAASFSYSNKISEFRQSWINDLRNDIADYLAAAERWFRKWDEINCLPSEEKAARERDEGFSPFR
jgi:hypothetical protein